MGESYRRDQEIFLWGPSGSGKTYLINALKRELQLMGNDLHEEMFVLKDMDGNRISGILAQPIEATSSPTTYELMLERIDNRLWETIVRHRIIIQDDSGDALLKMTETGNLGDERFGIILIDASLISNIGATKNSDTLVLNHDEIRSNIDKIIRLIDVLSKKPHKSYLAICLSKMDQIHLRWKDPKVLAEICLGSKSVSQLCNYASLRSKIELSYFITSSVGYCWDANNQEWPNYNPSSGSIHNIEAWRPWNVTAPFFWLFQKLETEFYQDTMRYPQPYY